MTSEGLGYIADIMDSLKIPYCFMRWTKDIPDRYFVGEYQETESDNMRELGYQEATFILNGFTRNEESPWAVLEADKEKIKEAATEHTKILKSGSGIALSYKSAYPVPADDSDLYRIQINLSVKEWRVNEDD